MNALKLFLLKSYLRLGLFFYFRRIKINGIGNIPLDQPTLILANHRNALIDALLIAVHLPKYGYFLTRASVFKKPRISGLLRGINMIPVYRIRDGWSTLNQNSSIFVHCIDLLSKNNIVVIFPEGSHNLVRRVRPLSKGFTRIVFDFLEKHPDQALQLVPVGINFSLTTGFPDEASVLIGQPNEIKVEPRLNRSEKVGKLKGQIHKAMSELTVQVPEDNYESIIQKLEEDSVDFLRPAEVNRCIRNEFRDCPKRQNPGLNIIQKVSKLLLKIIYFLPYLTWKRFIQPKIVEKEFIATFRFAAIVVLGPLYLVLIFILLGIISGWLTAFWISAIILLTTSLLVKL